MCCFSQNETLLVGSNFTRGFFEIFNNKLQSYANKTQSNKYLNAEFKNNLFKIK